MPPPLLTRYEIARLVGMRALQLDHGAEPRAHAPDEALRRDSTYMAYLELHEGRLDAQVRRGERVVDVALAELPPDVTHILNNRDGGARPVRHRP